MNEYCDNDVLVLRSCFETYRYNIITAFKIDPLQDALTVASTCFAIFTNNFLTKDNELLVIDRQRESGFSKEGITWIQTKERALKRKFVHARRFGGEKKMKLSNGRTIYADGFDYVSNKIYNYHGCKFHSCLLCGFGKTIINGISGEENYHKTLKIDKEISLEYNYESIWSHEIKERCKNDKKFAIEWKQLYENNSIKYKLDPGDALFGGRTNAFRLLVTSDELKNNNLRIRYLDFCSLYPFVMCKYPMPIGKPEIILKIELPSIEEFIKKKDEYFGLIKVKIQPPKLLFLPILPIRINNKLYFPLCKLCAEENLSKCNHTNEERSWIGTYVSIELFEALKEGYEIIEIYEIWKFKKSSNLFTEYIKHFLKLKVQASGFPHWVKSEDDKIKFINQYKEKEGIELDINEIKKNPAIRAMAKLKLNNLWGKLAQSNDRVNTKIVTNSDELSTILYDITKEIKFIHMTPTKAVVDFKKDNDIQNIGKNTNVPVSAFVTAYARLKLYEAMRKVNTSLLYTDTDSLIYLEPKDNEPYLNTGSFLGELTDEIIDGFGESSEACSFVSSGPKSYAIKIINNHGKETSIVKCKGITLSHENKELVNFETMVKLVLDENEYINTTGNRFKTGKYGGVKLIENNKIFRKTYMKRYISCYDTWKTLPYGYE